MGVAFLVQSHRAVPQLERLVARLLAGGPECVVHVSHDRAGADLHDSWLLAHERVLVELATGGYGDFSHVQRYLDAVDRLRQEGWDPDWYVNLTGQDYPLLPVGQIVAELDRTAHDGFLEHFPVLDAARSRWPVHRGRSRYWFRHRRLARLSPTAMRLLRPVQALNRVQPLLRVHVSYGLTLGLRVRPPFDGLQVHGGSAYWTLRRACVDHLLETLRARPALVEHYRACLSPEESLVQTVLVSSGRFDLVDDARRYFDFSGTRFNHPRTLTAQDVPVALAGSAHFARKLDSTVDPAALDLLDAAAAETDRQGQR